MRWADPVSGARSITRYLDAVRFKPFLVVRLRLGQRGRLGQAGRLARVRGHLDYARHLLGSCRSAYEFLPKSGLDVVQAEILPLRIALDASIQPSAYQ